MSTATSEFNKKKKKTCTRAPKKKKNSVIPTIQTSKAACSSAETVIEEKETSLTLEKFNLKCDKLSNNSNSCYIQDKFMQTFFTNYPEYLQIETCAEIPELDLCLVLFIGIDTNGHCDIVSIGLIKPNNTQELIWLCNCFKKHNPYWKKCELIFYDQTSQSDTLNKLFPNTKSAISFFHCMKEFKKDLFNLNPVVSAADIHKALNLFEKMIFTESGYVELVKQMKEVHPQILNLFKKKWHTKRKVWALGLYTDSKVLLKPFNAYSLNSRRIIKPVICCECTLENVFHKMHAILIKFRQESFKRFTTTFHSPSAPYLNVSYIKEYSKILTPFGAELINEQFKKSERMNLLKIDGFHYNVDGTTANWHKCSCTFYNMMMLPCCHIFKVRRYLSFTNTLVTTRPSWNLQKYINNFCNLYLVFVNYNKIKSERFQESTKICMELWNEIFRVSEEKSQARLEIFQCMLKSWKNHFLIEINSTDEQGYTSEAIEDMSADLFKEIYGITLEDILDSENDFVGASFCPEDTLDFL